MERDDSVLLMGEDIGQLGGVFRATDGLRQFFGPARVIDTPLAESVIAGSALGLAVDRLAPGGRNPVPRLRAAVLPPD